MNTQDKNLSTDISLGHLLDVLATSPQAALIFHYEGHAVKPGYHVTEVKAGQFSALDCGANPEAWSEVFVQLWDVDGDSRTHMPAGKFAAIIRKVCEHVRLESSARLTFEVSDGEKPISLYCAASPRLKDGAFEVTLAARPASCKPRDRWLSAPQTQSACCGPSANGKCCP